MRRSLLASLLAPAFLLAGAFFLAPPAHAAGLTADQINSVVSLLSSFGVSADTIAQVQATLSGTPNQGEDNQGGPAWGFGTSSTGFTPPGRVVSSEHRPPCPPGLDRDLSEGDRGADVADLQEYLASTTGFSAGATGYFGPLTAAAVKRLQGDNGLPASGFFGPMSRAHFNCGQGGNPPGFANQASLSASPASGAAPLAVTFSATQLPGPGAFIIDFGDGSNSGSTTPTCTAPTRASSSTPPTPGSCSFSAAHTYTSSGTYTALLEGYIGCMWGNPRCMIATMPLATTSVSVQ